MLSRCVRINYLFYNLRSEISEKKPFFFKKKIGGFFFNEIHFFFQKIEKIVETIDVFLFPFKLSLFSTPNNGRSFSAFPKRPAFGSVHQTCNGYVKFYAKTHTVHECSFYRFLVIYRYALDFLLVAPAEHVLYRRCIYAVFRPGPPRTALKKYPALGYCTRSRIIYLYMIKKTNRAVPAG